MIGRLWDWMAEREVDVQLLWWALRNNWRPTRHHCENGHRVFSRFNDRACFHELYHRWRNSGAAHHDPWHGLMVAMIFVSAALLFFSWAWTAIS
jgi:hypothetical protein